MSETYTSEQRYSLDEFIKSTGESDKRQGKFELESSRMLEVNLDGRVFMKNGAMISYIGNMAFEREGMFEKGLGHAFKKFMSGEASHVTKADGKGKLYLADHGKRVHIINLEGQTLCVEGNDILAFEDSVQYEIEIVKSMAHLASGGLWYIELKGKGMAAITTHGTPLTLKVTPGKPVITDPNATVAWSGTLKPDLKFDVGMKTLLGKGGGEAVSYEFKGEGFVVVQPYEEVYYTAM